MTVFDTSAVVAAFASWHEQHEAAREALRGGGGIVAQCAMETYSVLTRLPAPHRAAAPLVRDFLAAQFPNAYLQLDVAGQRELLARLPDLGITGGAVYDALIAATCTATGATLVSCDRRALPTYERCSATVRLLAAA